MRSRLCAGSIAFLLVIVVLLFILPVAPVFASTTGSTGNIRAISHPFTLPIAAPTPDPSSVVSAANNAVSQAQSLLNVLGLFAAILGIVLTFLALVATVLTLVGVRSYREVRLLADKFRDDMATVRAEADNTRAALVYLSLGDRLLNQHDTDEALKNYREAGKLLPGDTQVQLMLGRIYSGAGEYEDAITTLEDTIKLLESTTPVNNERLGNVEKELGLAYRRRGNSLNQDADYDEAIQHLKKAVVLNPADSDTQAILGGLYRRKHKYAEAYTAYQQAWKRDHGSSYALGNVASLAWYEGNTEESRRYFTFAEGVAVDRIKRGQGEIYWDYYDLALAQLALGRTADALRNYSIAIKETPGKVQFDSVLDNLYLLQKSLHPIPGLNDAVKMIEDAAR